MKIEMGAIAVKVFIDKAEYDLASDDELEILCEKISDILILLDIDGKLPQQLKNAGINATVEVRE